jgi:hypothetical protein
MHTIAAAGAGFLIAVLWFDLMFDVQARGGAVVLPQQVLASISAYYRRVTTEASPMGRLVTLVMLITVAALVVEVARCEGARWASGASLAAALIGMGLALVRTVRTAVRLGAATDPPDVRTTLARRILADHLASLAAMSVVLALQVAT